MSGIEAADKVEIQILVDNATDMLSSNPPFVESEAANLTRRGFKLNAYKCLCCAVHGLSCLVTVHRGDVRRTVLFDTGPEDSAFERNV
ncbi:MAG TPA: MBL fold metallo-hydrolase, partial [Bradyrhizobium sp.]|nr:MBL fold metallo-hydrolase [Bradyrhizobium sp.]